ncbi:MAG: MFS transporter [Myxococcota bacterium]
MAPDTRESLSLGTRLAFSAQGFVGAAMLVLVSVYLGKFYVDVVLLPAGLFAIAVAAGRALDAITDPAMGFISDTTHARHGGVANPEYRDRRWARLRTARLGCG